MTVEVDGSGIYTDDTDAEIEGLPGTWYVYHHILNDGTFVGISSTPSFVVLDACSQVKVKSLTTINGLVMENYLHVQASVVPYSYTTASVETDYLLEMVLTLDNGSSDIFDLEEFTWSSSSPGSMSSNWPCTATAPYFHLSSVKPDSNLVLNPTTATITSFSDLTVAPRFQLSSLPASGDVQLYSFLL